MIKRLNWQLIILITFGAIGLYFNSQIISFVKAACYDCGLSVSDINCQEVWWDEPYQQAACPYPLIHQNYSPDGSCPGTSCSNSPYGNSPCSVVASPTNCSNCGNCYNYGQVTYYGYGQSYYYAQSPYQIYYPYGQTAYQQYSQSTYYSYSQGSYGACDLQGPYWCVGTGCTCGGTFYRNPCGVDTACICKPPNECYSYSQSSYYPGYSQNEYYSYGYGQSSYYNYSQSAYPFIQTEGGNVHSNQ